MRQRDSTAEMPTCIRVNNGLKIKFSKDIEISSLYYWIVPKVRRSK